MPQFKDKNGKEWNVALDGPTIREVRKLGVDLAALDGSASERLYNDPVLLVDSLWLVCREQANRDGITSDQFGRALVGDPIEPATDALIEAINDFFPKGRRERMQTLTARMKETREAGTKEAMELLLDPNLQTQIQGAMKIKAQNEIQQLLSDLTRSNSATESPGQSASVPAA